MLAQGRGNKKKKKKSSSHEGFPTRVSSRWCALNILGRLLLAKML